MAARRGRGPRRVPRPRGLAARAAGGARGWSRGRTARPARPPAQGEAAVSSHILDRPAWNALATRQRSVASGGDRARRFAPDIGPLAGARDDGPASLAELAKLVPGDGTLLLLQADPIVLPPGLVATTTAMGVQMVAERLARGAVTAYERAGQRLPDADAPAMLALATLTKPGPFARGTPTLGEFWGLKEGGVLVAMAGERMKHHGFTEVSGVCTHPDARGRGLARALSALVAARIVERGETPYLHTYATNTAAIRLYESLGFRRRCAMHVAAVARDAQPAGR
ncbi:MAG: GNAT family N-acetyltransferase [Deltaproteobacteria bacterium]|nr:GNAT family N-acetyltransferase [Deltaproteobacteria bacterium]